jgi:hypothetical protein
MDAVKADKRAGIVVPTRSPLERYTSARRAEFLLSNSATQKDYRRARKEVKKLGLDPEAIRHRRPE